MGDEASQDFPELELSDQDVTEAMEEIPGYLDITPGDFRELYHLALRHAWRRLRRSATVREVMTARVVVVQPETPLGEVAERMARAGVSGVPVVDAQGRAVGVISEADFLSRMAEETGTGFMGVVAQCLQGKKCLAVPVRGRAATDIMSSPPVTVPEGATVAAVAQRMASSGVNRVPVVDSAGVVVGIVSRADLLRAHLL
ncbi:MAG: CBS domain-containing protein [Deferrisomatales bacterium]|nr:CBS domain-containing protein [Deferrisomatales bacterium]